MRAPRGAPWQTLLEALETETDHCIEWPHGRSKEGYGLVKLDGRNQGAHRVVCMILNGPPPTPNHEAAHAPIICHNRACINPRHIRWATSAENHHDSSLDGTAHRRGGRPRKT